MLSQSYIRRRAKNNPKNIPMTPRNLPRMTPKRLPGAELSLSGALRTASFSLSGWKFELSGWKSENFLGTTQVLSSGRSFPDSDPSVLG